MLSRNVPDLVLWLNHHDIIVPGYEEQGSAFIAGPGELQSRKTQTGAGLHAFLKKNLDQFESDVAQEIRKLEKEVGEDG